MPKARLCLNDCCRFNPTDLDDVLGHDLLGHRTRNLLCRAGYYSAAAVAQLSDADLLAIGNFGAGCLARVRERIPVSAQAGAR